MKRNGTLLLLIALGLIASAAMIAPVRERIVSWLDTLKRFIARHEGLRLEAYRDPVGLWTIGYGHLIKPGERFYPHGPVRRITQEEAEELLVQDTAKAAACVEEHVKVPLTENQKAALVSFVFNVGCANFARSTLLRLLNESRYAEAAAELDKWTWARGKKLAGLIRRRAEERDLFLS